MLIAVVFFKNINKGCFPFSESGVKGQCSCLLCRDFSSVKQCPSSVVVNYEDQRCPPWYRNCTGDKG